MAWAIDMKFERVMVQKEYYIQVPEALFIQSAQDLANIPNLELIVSGLIEKDNKSDEAIQKQGESLVAQEKDISSLKIDLSSSIIARDQFAEQTRQKIEENAKLQSDINILERNKWLYFVGGILVTVGATYLASMAVK